MPERLRVGVIGCGQITQATHLPTLNTLAHHFRVASCCDVSADVVEEVSARYGALPTTRAADILEDPSIDVVLIATPDMTHADLAVAACEAKKRAVLLEKPIALNARIARMIAESSERHGVPVLVNTMHVYDPAVQRAMELWGPPGGAQYGHFRVVIGENSKFTEDDILETIRPSGVNPFAAMTGQLAWGAIAAERFGADVPLSIAVGYILLAGLVIHEIPVLRRFAGEPEHIDYARIRSFGDPVSPLNKTIDAVFSYPRGRVILESEILPIRTSDIGFELRRDDLHLKVRYPNTWAMAAPSECSVLREKDGMAATEHFAGRYETGFRRAWRHVHAVATGQAKPNTHARDAVRDMEILEAIAEAALVEERRSSR